MEVDSGVAQEPAVDGRGLVSGRIVQHDVDLETLRHRLVDGLEELLELDGSVAGGELVDDHPACQIERRVQVDGAVTDIVVRASFGCAGQEWEDRPGAVQGLHLCLLVHAMNNGSLDNLKVSSSHGLRPNAFQMRLIVGWDMPVALAMPRVDQCVASLGFSVKVFTTTAST